VALEQADGTKRYVWRTDFRIKTNDGYMAASIGRDITNLKQDEEKLVESLRVNNLLLRELHHRVKNNIQMIISLLNLKSGQVKDPESLGILGECQNQLYAMALVHSMLNDPMGADEIDLKEYLSLLAEALVTDCDKEGELSFVFEAEKVVIPAEMAIPCGLIANELITNALKYAFPKQDSGRKNEIHILLKKQRPDCAELTIQDNGCGVHPGIQSNSPRVAGKGESFGMLLVEMLVKQIMGSLRIEFCDGVRTSVEFPIARKE
jgi:two-component sensor histidine kinase